MKLREALTLTRAELTAEIMQIPGARRGAHYLYIPGPGAVPLVAHIDRIGDDSSYSKRPETRLICYDPKIGVYWSPDGLGADDRAGVWAALKARDRITPAPPVILCDLEETGGDGGREAAAALEDDARRFTALIGLDRRGHAQAVYYNDEPKKFRKIAKRNGFKTEAGSFSDIATLGRRWNVCSVNLSIGYAREHTDAEYLVTASAYYTLHRLPALVRALSAERHALPPPPPAKSYFSPYQSPARPAVSYMFARRDWSPDNQCDADKCSAYRRVGRRAITEYYCPYCTRAQGAQVDAADGDPDADTPPEAAFICPHNADPRDCATAAGLEIDELETNVCPDCEPFND